uniref:Putative glycosyltransferase n=1 Tax=viral metagenome TaxID=1070528 RepID=A0A6M3XLS1_9ZZZZ
MRVLHLLHGLRGNPKRIHYDRIEKLMDLCPVYIYGPNEKELNGESISPIEFKSDLQINDIIKELDIDILLLPEIFFCNKYFPVSGIEKVKKIPKVILENDIYMLKDLDCFKKAGIELIINLHPYDPETLPINSVWLPPAVSDEFLVDSIENRIDRVVYIGGGRFSQNKYYETRQNAIRILENKLILDFHGEVGYSRYPEILKRYEIALSCSWPPLYFPPIKTFEIMASGSILLTTKFVFSDLLFGTDKLYYEYKDDCSDLYEIVEYLLHNKEEAREVANRAMKIIKESHLHIHRVKELFDILYAVVDGSIKVPKKWGI